MGGLTFGAAGWMSMASAYACVPIGPCFGPAVDILVPSGGRVGLNHASGGMVAVEGELLHYSWACNQFGAEMKMGRCGGRIHLCASHSSEAYNKIRVKTHCYALIQLNLKNLIPLGIDVAQTDGRQETHVHIPTAEKREFGA